MAKSDFSLISKKPNPMILPSVRSLTQPPTGRMQQLYILNIKRMRFSFSPTSRPKQNGPKQPTSRVQAVSKKAR